MDRADDQKGESSTETVKKFLGSVLEDCSPVKRSRSENNRKEVVKYTPAQLSIFWQKDGKLGINKS